MNTSPHTPHPLHERVELIVHLLKFSDRLFVIMGESPEKLRNFSDLLLEKGGVGLLFARIHPELALNAEDIATDLARAWGIELSLGESPMQAIEQRLPERLPEPRRAVAIIEEADRLPIQTLSELVAFMQRLDAQTGGRARLVLLGGPHLAARLRELPDMAAGGQIYALHLAPPPAEAFADMTSGEPADDAPSAIFERPAPPSREGSALPTRTLMIGGVAASLTLAVVIALLLRPSEPEAPKDQQVSIPLKSEPVATLPPASTATPPPPSTAVTPQEQAVPALPAPTGHQLTEAAPETRPVASPPAVAKPAPVEVKPSAPVVTAESKPLPPAPPSSAEPKLRPAASAPAAEPTRPPPATSPATTQAPKKPANWYAQQKGDQYVLQVVSLSSEGEVERFIKKNALQECHSFRQVRNGQTLHTLTCGLYPNREAALQAAAKLPEAARAGKPFPRKVDDIRKIMQP